MDILGDEFAKDLEYATEVSHMRKRALGFIGEFADNETMAEIVKMVIGRMNGSGMLKIAIDELDREKFARKVGF